MIGALGVGVGSSQAVSASALARTLLASGSWDQIELALGALIVMLAAWAMRQEVRARRHERNTQSGDAEP